MCFVSCQASVPATSVVHREWMRKVAWLIEPWRSVSRVGELRLTCLLGHLWARLVGLVEAQEPRAPTAHLLQRKTATQHAAGSGPLAHQHRQPLTSSGARGRLYEAVCGGAPARFCAKVTRVRWERDLTPNP